MARNAPLDFARHDRAVTHLKRYEQRFILSPRHFKSGITMPVLAWSTITFSASRVKNVISKPGLYAFSVVTRRIGLPPHGYILYVGQTGFKSGTARTLRARAGEYLRSKHSSKRPNVWEFLNKWWGNLNFHFVSVDPIKEDLSKLEQALNNALMPPYSVNDFSPEIKRLKKAWQRT
jgi:hypothetical protein